LEAKNTLGVQDAFPIDDIEDILPGLLEGKSRVYYSAGKDKSFDSRLMHWVDEVRNNRSAEGHLTCEFVELDHLLGELRLIKSAAEIKLMRKAADISAQAHCRAMKHCSVGQKEYQLQAEIEHEFMMSGASGPAYTSIVGSGSNACVLHYIENSATLKSGDLVLIDAGCEYQNYAADITRTFPVNGKYSPAQAAIYDIVLAAQDAAIKTIGPGVSFDQANKAAIEVITGGLVDLGILNGEVDSLMAEGAYRDFYMHSVSHWLGMDVHDVGDYKVDSHWRVYEPGMLLTIEPGIYISSENTQVDKKWRGIGVRIEDDILVTKKGHEVLTDGVPKQRDQIEKLMA
jgi:Xaa-Pro aminopeptidase